MWYYEIATQFNIVFFAMHVFILLCKNKHNVFLLKGADDFVIPVFVFTRRSVLNCVATVKV